MSFGVREAFQASREEVSVSTPPLIVAPREPLRSGAKIARMICSLCKVKVQPLGVSGSQTTVGCPKCGLAWKIDGYGQVVRV